VCLLDDVWDVPQLLQLVELGRIGFLLLPPCFRRSTQLRIQLVRSEEEVEGGSRQGEAEQGKDEVEHDSVLMEAPQGYRQPDRANSLNKIPFSAP
jgi:hypothetical protein